MELGAWSIVECRYFYAMAALAERPPDKRVNVAVTPSLSLFYTDMDRNTIEVRDGLKVGDRVILSDMSRYDSYGRIRLN